jgi:hypothetical protein
MSEKVLTIVEPKTYRFNVSNLDKYYKIQEKFYKNRKEYIKVLLDWYEKQDREVIFNVKSNSVEQN